MQKKTFTLIELHRDNELFIHWLCTVVTSNEFFVGFRLFNGFIEIVHTCIFEAYFFILWFLQVSYWNRVASALIRSFSL